MQQGLVFASDMKQLTVSVHLPPARLCLNKTTQHTELQVTAFLM